MSVVEDLRARIRAGRIIFDNARPGQGASLRRELLGENTGTKVTERLQVLVLEVSELQRIRISSILRGGGGSHHSAGRAFDVGNEDIASDLLPRIATDARVKALGIDELIFDATRAGQADRNEWNYDRGRKHNFNSVTLNQHRNHIHFAVKAG